MGQCYWIFSCMRSSCATLASFEDGPRIRIGSMMNFWWLCWKNQVVMGNLLWPGWGRIWERFWVKQWEKAATDLVWACTYFVPLEMSFFPYLWNYFTCCTLIFPFHLVHSVNNQKCNFKMKRWKNSLKRASQAFGYFWGATCCADRA